ncbi:MAG: hypothetical protein AAGD10_19450 [Myxococcota bacterium]
MSASVEDEARSRLEAHGYRVDFRRDGWCECWIRDGQESWFGRGDDPAQAFEAALARMLPSRLARSLWRGLASGAPPPSPGTGLVRPGEGAPPSKADASRHLGFIERRIEALGAELGVFAQERQRLAMLSWMCEARSQTERFPEDEAISEQVAAISRKLSELGKAYWPGSVSALQLAIEPSALPRSQLGGTAGTWAEAAMLSRRGLLNLEAADLERGLDLRGWAEDESPAPADPEALLDEVVNELVERHGRLDKGAEPERERAAPAPEDFARWSHRLRWVRARTTRPRLWGQAFGRLRWWGQRRQSGLGPATQGLDPDFAPPGGWSALVGGPTSSTSPRLSARAARSIVLAGARRDPTVRDDLEAAGLKLEVYLVDPSSDDWAPTLEGVDVVVAAFGLALSPIEERMEQRAFEAGAAFAWSAAYEATAVLRALGPY